MKINKKNILLSFLSFLWLISSASFANAEEKVKIAVIGSEGELAKELDLLTVEFSKDREYKVLSRSDWTKLIREYEILKKDTASAYSKFGNISGADALVILDKQSFKKQDYLICKLVSTKNGLILDALAMTYPVISKEMNWLAGVKKHFGRKLAKLASASNGLKAVSLLNLRAETSSPELLELEKQINAILAYRLKRNESILVTERENMPDILFEKYLNKGDESQFKTGLAVVDGSIKVNNGTVDVAMRLKTPEGGIKTIKASGKINDPTELAVELEKLLLKSIGKEIMVNKTVEMKVEADEYLKEAYWAYNCGLYDLSAKAAESAWALGNRSSQGMILRILSYSKIALSGTNNSGVEENEINSAIISMELLKRHIIHPYTMGKEMPEISYLDTHNWGDLAINAVSASSVLLHNYYMNQSLNDNRAKLFYLRKLVRETVEVLLKKSPYSSKIWGLAMKNIPFWYENYYDTKQAYEDVLLVSLNGAGTGLASNAREIFANKQFYFVDWGEKITRKRHDKMINRLAKDLCESKKLQLRLDGLWLQIENAYWMKGLSEEKLTAEIKDIVLKNRYLFYQGKIWFCRRLFENALEEDLIKKLIIGYLKYLINNPEARQGPNIHKLIVRSKVLYAFKQEELPLLYKKIRNWEKMGHKGQVLKPSEFANSKMNNFALLKEVIFQKCPELKTGSTDSVMIMDYWLPRKDMTPSSVGNYGQLDGTLVYKDKIYCLLYKNHADKVDAFYIYILNNTPKVEKRIKIPAEWNNGNLFVNDKYIAITSGRSEIIIYEREAEEFKIIPINGYSIDRMVIQGNTVYACYSVYGNQIKIESGIMKMGLDGENLNILASSRRNPAKTPLDNVPPSEFQIFRNLNGNTLFVSIGDGKEYVIQKDKILPLASMDKAFFDKYLHKIYHIGKIGKKYIAVWKTLDAEYLCSQPENLRKEEDSFLFERLPYNNIDYRNAAANQEKLIVMQKDECNFILCKKLKGIPSKYKVPYDLGFLHSKLQEANQDGASTLTPVAFAGDKVILASNIAISAVDIGSIEKIAEKKEGIRQEELGNSE